MRAFGAAAEQEHALDIELGIVRSHMQSGQYRRALAFAAHAAGAHDAAPEGAVLYAWLLHMGGQAAIAARLLTQAELRLPGDPLLIQVRQALAETPARPSKPLLEAPLRVAPYSAVQLPQGVRVVGTATRLPGSRLAIAPTPSIDPQRPAWLRDGMGMTFAARTMRRIDAVRLVVLHMAPVETDEKADASASDAALAERDPFPGSPAFAAEYAPTADETPAWPCLYPGFLGRAGDDGQRSLGIDMPIGPRGGPVFDQGGRWIGVAFPDVQSPRTDDILTPSRLREHLDKEELATSAATGPSPTRRPVDQIYESAMAVTLQILQDASSRS